MPNRLERRLARLLATELPPTTFWARMNLFPGHALAAGKRPDSCWELLEEQSGLDGLYEGAEAEL
jgi:hypothetical protein